MYRAAYSEIDATLNGRARLVCLWHGSCRAVRVWDSILFERRVASLMPDEDVRSTRDCRKAFANFAVNKSPVISLCPLCLCGEKTRLHY